MKVFFNKQWNKILQDTKKLEDENKKLKQEKFILETEKSALLKRIEDLTPKRNEKGQFVSKKKE